MNLEPFLYWIEERESIRLKRAAGQPAPWTGDKILQEFRFCNVRREDDRVTRWIDEHIRKRYAGDPNLWFMLCIARQLNWPPTLAELIEEGAWPDTGRPGRRYTFSPLEMANLLEQRAARGDKVYTGVYMIRAETDPKVEWYSWSKQRYTAELVLGKLWYAYGWEEVPATLQAKHEYLMKFRGWGPFMAWQAIVDMCFTPILADAPDRHSWGAAGPGTIRGLNRLHERPVKQALSQAKALEELQTLFTLLKKATTVSFDWTDTMNICCEVDKYLRVQSGEGRPRNLYKPEL